MKKGTLVLEGGATRGVFSAGALDFLMEKDYYFSDVIGVSMGACNGVDYVSKQIGRSKNCIITKDKTNSYYNNFRKMIHEKSILDMDMIFDVYPNKVVPFDYDTYFASETNFIAVTTNCITGQAEYMTEKEDKERLMKVCRASSSMPVVSPMVEIDGIPYLDGGVSDSIPLAKALEFGNEKIVVVQTRNPGYRKKMPSKATAKMYCKYFKKYPNMAKTCIKRNLMYNKQMKLVEQMEAENKIFVLRPLIPTVSRLERDYDALMHFYMHGYKLMSKQFDELCRYMES